MTTERDARYALGESPVEIRINWKGRLPYPEGEIVPGLDAEAGPRSKSKGQ